MEQQQPLPPLPASCLHPDTNTNTAPTQSNPTTTPSSTHNPPSIPTSNPTIIPSTTTSTKPKPKPKPPTESKMDDPTTRAAILALSNQMSLAATLTLPQKTNRKGQPIDPRPTLKSQYNAMTIKRGRKFYQKGSSSSTTPSTTPTTPELDAKTQQILKIVMDKSAKNGYKVTEAYATDMLVKKEYKLVDAIKGIGDDIDRREKIIHQTGRMNIPHEWALQTAYTANTPSASHPNSQSQLSTSNLPCHSYLSSDRDTFISIIEQEDRDIAEVLTQGWQSFYGKMIVKAKGKPTKEREEAFKIYHAEAVYREARGKMWRELHGESHGGLTEVERGEAMVTWERLNRPDVMGDRWDMEDAFVAGSKPKLLYRENFGVSKEPAEKTPDVAKKEKIILYFDDGTSMAEEPFPEDDPNIESKASSSIPSRAKPNPRPANKNSSIQKPIPKPVSGNSNVKSSNGIGSIASPIIVVDGAEKNVEEIEIKSRQDEMPEEFIFDGNTTVVALQTHADSLIRENIHLHNTNYNLRVSFIERLLGEINNPPEPKIIFETITKITDWDLQFIYALDDDELPVLYSHELFELLDKLCRAMHAASAKAADVDLRAGIKKAWKNAPLGNGRLLQAIEESFVVSPGLMAVTLFEKWGQTIDMAALLDEIFFYLDIELPVLDNKAKRARKEDKKLQGMLKRCLEWWLNKCTYPKDLSWKTRGQRKMRFGNQLLRKQVEMKFIELASANTPTETMNKSNAKLYTQCLAAANRNDQTLIVFTEFERYRNMMKQFRADGIQPARILAGWRINIKDESLHNLLATLMLIAAEEEETKYTEVIQLFREAIHEELFQLYQWAKHDPDSFVRNIKPISLLAILGDPELIRDAEPTDEMVWDWVLRFQIAKSRLSGDVHDILGWAAYLEGENSTKLKAMNVAAESVSKINGTINIQAMDFGDLRPVKGAMDALLTIVARDFIKSKLCERECLRETIGRLRRENGSPDFDPADDDQFRDTITEQDISDLYNEINRVEDHFEKTGENLAMSKVTPEFDTIVDTKNHAEQSNEDRQDVELRAMRLDDDTETRPKVVFSRRDNEPIRITLGKDPLNSNIGREERMIGFIGAREQVLDYLASKAGNSDTKPARPYQATVEDEDEEPSLYMSMDEILTTLLPHDPDSREIRFLTTDVPLRDGRGSSEAMKVIVNEFQKEVAESHQTMRPTQLLIDMMASFKRSLNRGEWASLMSFKLQFETAIDEGVDLVVPGMGKGRAKDDRLSSSVAKNRHQPQRVVDVLAADMEADRTREKLAYKAWKERRAMPGGVRRGVSTGDESELFTKSKPMANRRGI
ncbi:uncharacterized protein RAG0_16219 [Rhynchosporium agropyri]|uniref:Uncharacterized protein n=1 Tax=Rhynchosporium agropyri TaxID=914238 RepID=A0A1E1LPF3_9HELO|nr:uncharacterized protein RAG0_16219 [Rhynchosporium agropyri]